MVEIRRVGTMSLGVTLALIYTALGLIFGLMYACFALLGMPSSAAGLQHLPGIGGGGAVTPLIYVIYFPILYGVLGFIVGAIGGALYDFVAGFAGGIKMELSGFDLVKGA